MSECIAAVSLMNCRVATSSRSKSAAVQRDAGGIVNVWCRSA